MTYGTASGQMILVTGVYPVGAHLAGWRHPSAYPEIVMNLDAMIDLAQLAEKGKFHALFLADGNAVRQMETPELFESPGPSDRPASFEPTTVMAAISQHTSRIGMFATSTTTYDSPYLVARRFSSLDHISKGRAIWNVVTGSFPGDSLNFGVDDLPDHATRYARSMEFLEVCKGLWDSWAPDAFPQDKESGRFLDSTKVRNLNHSGEFFTVKGPLNLARSPQGQPVLFMAGQSEPGREMAAKHADCLFSVAATKDESIAVYDDIKSRMAKYGRHPDELKIIPGIRANVAETRAEALALYAELNELISPRLGVQYLSSNLHFDVSGYDIDGPLPELPEFGGVTSIRESIVADARANVYTIRQTYEHLLANEATPPFTGTASEVADEMQEWFEAGACDGFNVNMPTQPLGLARFVEFAIPELQRRGLFHLEYEGQTVREELGLPVPVSQFS